MSIRRVLLWKKICSSWWTTSYQNNCWRCLPLLVTELVLSGAQCSREWDGSVQTGLVLAPAYNEFGYNEHPSATSGFLCIKTIHKIQLILHIFALYKWDPVHVFNINYIEPKSNQIKQNKTSNLEAIQFEGDNEKLDDEMKCVYSPLDPRTDTTWIRFYLHLNSVHFSTLVISPFLIR